MSKESFISPTFDKKEELLTNLLIENNYDEKS
jgi:hypothetical protein